MCAVSSSARDWPKPWLESSNIARGRDRESEERKPGVESSMLLVLVSFEDAVLLVSSEYEVLCFVISNVTLKRGRTVILFFFNLLASRKEK